MNVVIIEGLDNTGKTTTINNLTKRFSDKRTIVVHCAKPEGSTFKEMAEFQNAFYAKLAKKLISFKLENKYDIVILDRSWYGEYVYGQLYREHDQLDILMNIKMVEESLLNAFKQNELSFILLNVSDPEFSIKHDDGLSISEADYDKIKSEQKLFEEIFKQSLIFNKANIIVNTGSEFRPSEAIMHMVCSKIKIK